MTLIIDAVGVPAPSGSKRAFVVNGRAIMKESSAKVRPWWQAVVGATQEALDKAPAREAYPLTGPVEVTVIFYMPRPGYHFRSGARAHELKPGAPSYVDKKPDVDKLCRSVLDALKGAGVYRDDSQVAVLSAGKEYANGATGARIVVAPALDVVAASASTPDAATAPTQHEAMF